MYPLNPSSMLLKSLIMNEEKHQNKRKVIGNLNKLLSKKNKFSLFPLCGLLIFDLHVQHG